MTTDPDDENSAERAFNEAREKQFSLSLQKALQSSDVKFLEHVSEHWETLDREDVQEKLSDDIDINSKTFDQDTLRRGLESHRTLLQAVLVQSKDANSFIKACQAYIDTEMKRLFFVTNDLATARVGRDYFLQFVERALPKLKAKGFLSEGEDEEIQALIQYYDLHFDMYDAQRTEVETLSQNQTRSLVIFALSQDEAGDKEHDAALLHDPGVLDDQEKTVSIISRTFPMYDDIIAKYNITLEGEEEPSPSLVWIGVNAQQIAKIEMQNSIRPGMNRAEKAQLGKAYINRMGDILDESFALLNKHKDVHGMLAIRSLFERLYSEANHMPLEITEIVNKALEGAAEETLPHIGVCASRHYDALTMRQPDSTSTQRYLYPKYGTLDRITEECYEVGEKLHGEMLKAGSVRGMASIAEKFVDRASTDIFFAFNEPAVFFFLQDYLKHFTDEVAWSLHKTGHMDPKEIDLLRDVQKKCVAYHESFCTMKEWMLAYTNNAYDHPFIKNAFEATAATGRALPDMMKTEEWRDDIRPKAWVTFTEVLQSMDVHKKGFVHPLIPLLFKRASQIALAEYGGEHSTSGSKDEGMQFERIRTRAKTIFEEALAEIPEKDPYSGKKIKIHAFGCEEVLPILKKLDSRLQEISNDALLGKKVIGRA